MDTFGICLLSYIPMREKPSHASQQTSQLVWGEPYMLNNKSSDQQWLQVSSVLDGYSGWMDSSQYQPIQIDKIPALEDYLFVAKSFSLDSPLANTVPFGGLYTKALSLCYPTNINDSLFEYSSDWQSVKETLHQYVGIPYLWGGKTNMGIDCSAFVQNIYRLIGKWIPRDAHQQASIGQKESSSLAESGDLAFFTSPNSSKITHVGLLLDNSKIIHASGTVRIDSIDGTGIWIENGNNQKNHERSEHKSYTHILHQVNKMESF